MVCSGNMMFRGLEMVVFQWEIMVESGGNMVVTAIEESKDLSSLSLDELIGNLNVHEMIMEKDSELVGGKGEKIKSLALKTKRREEVDLLGNRVTKRNHSKFGGDDVRGWLQCIRAMGGNVPWDNYRNTILQRFGNAFDDPLAEIKNVRHVTTIEDYQNAFDKLINKVDFPIDQLVDGNKLISTLVCKKFTWQLHGEIFEINAMLVPLGGCEMVLGKGKIITLRGTQKSTLQWMQGKKLVQPVAELSSMMLCVYPVAKSPLIHSEESIQTPTITELIHKYSDVFVVLTFLPLGKAYDHKIILREGAALVNVRPYMHPPTQKDAIESMVMSC
ncbi:hypothetical protein Tco_0961250 [Tanacetum coccineum]